MSGAIHFDSGRRRLFDIRYIARCSVLGTLVLLNHPYSSMSNQPHFPSSCIALSSGQPSPLCKLELHLEEIRITCDEIEQLVLQLETRLLKLRRMCSTKIASRHQVELSAENIDSLKDRLVSITVHPIHHESCILLAVAL